MLPAGISIKGRIKRSNPKTKPKNINAMVIHKPGAAHKTMKSNGEMTEKSKNHMTEQYQKLDQ